GNPNLPGEAGRYMYAHAYSMWFLAEVYGEVEDVDVRKKMEDVLTRAVKFAKEAQTTRGGWGYVTAKDGRNFDEGAITFVQIHALISARNAGIPVPREMLDKAYDYCVKSQNGKGGIIYSLTNPGGDGRPTISAEALAFLQRYPAADQKVMSK